MRFGDTDILYHVARYDYHKRVNLILHTYEAYNSTCGVVVLWMSC